MLETAEYGLLEIAIEQAKSKRPNKGRSLLEFPSSYVILDLETTGLDPVLDNIIEFDGKNWSIMDPRLAANNSASDVKKYVGNGKNYVTKYTY